MNLTFFEVFIPGSNFLEMEDNTTYQISQVLFCTRTGSTTPCEPCHQMMTDRENMQQDQPYPTQMETSIEVNQSSTQGNPSDHDPTGILTMMKDPSPFTCDIASIIEECVSEMSVRTFYLEETVKTTTMQIDRPEEEPSSTSSLPVASSSNKPSGKRKQKPHPNKIYVCNWCQKAEFKSGQGLRFHKVLRCPSREQHLGESAR